MLKDHFYSVLGISSQEKKVSAKITLHREHAIYKGHFPDNPITPGVCQLQIVKEVLEDVLGRNYYLAEAKNIKFLNVLTPGESDLQLDFDYAEFETGVKVNAILSGDNIVFLKLSGTFLTGLEGSP